MSQSVVLVSVIEVALIILTTLLLVQPKSMFPSSPAFKSIANWCGLFLLCVTFCWSVVVGIVLSLNDFILRV